MRWFLAVLAAVLLAPVVAGHAVYLESSPAKGERLATAPTEAWVRLTEPVDPDTYSFEVIDTQGNKASAGKPSLVAGPQARLSTNLRNDLSDGAYLMRWQVLSTADGHVTSGSTGFAIGDATPPPSSTDGDDTQTSLVSPWARLASFLGLSLAAGALLFSWLGRRIAWTQPGLPRLLVAGAIINTLGVVLLFLDTVRQSGLSFSAVAKTDVGLVLVVRLVASFVAVGIAEAIAKVGVVRRNAAIGVILCLLVASAASARLGHASLYGASAILVDLMHLATVSVWVGGLFVYWAILLRAARRESPEADVRSLGISFGPIALGCVAALTVTGLVTTWTITRDYVPGLDLLQSAWGRFLALKVGLLGVMLAAAAVNRYVLLAAPGTRPSPVVKPFATWIGQVGPSGQSLRRVLQVEAIFGVGTLFLAALLTSISPPSVIAASTAEGAQPVEIEALGEVYGFFGTWDEAPASGASTALTFRIVDHHEGAPVTNNTCGRDSCVWLEVTPPGEGGGVQVFRAEPYGSGQWRTAPILWVEPGFYSAVLKVQTEYVYLDEMPFDVAVA